MKILIALSLLLVSFSSFAQTYFCHSTGGANIGPIVLTGDPVRDIYEKITINKVSQRIRQSTSDSVYLYLYDAKTNTQSYALEIVNFESSYESFQMSVFGPDHIVLGSRKISRYNCLKQ